MRGAPKPLSWPFSNGRPTNEQLKQPPTLNPENTRGIVDEDEQGAGRAPILEPAVLAAVDLDQFP
jgi:hypothetical protein